MLIIYPISRKLSFNQMSIHLIGYGWRSKKIVPLKENSAVYFKSSHGPSESAVYFPLLLCEPHETVYLYTEWGCKRLIHPSRVSLSTGLKCSCEHQGVFDLWCLPQGLSCCPGKYSLPEVWLRIWINLSLLYHSIWYARQTKRFLLQHGLQRRA